MREALALAESGEGLTRPNPPVGAVVVRKGRRVGQGYHRLAGGPHAEVNALKDAGAKTVGATLYVTLEPCCTFGRTPPCTDLIVDRKIARVVVGARDPNPRHRGRGVRVLRDWGLDTRCGVCRKAAARLIEPFAKWVTTGHPFVTLKLGMSLDGKIADRKGRSKWITCPESRRRVQAMRRRADAVLVGAHTLRADDPSLLPRPARGRRPYRVVVDSAGGVPLSARLLNDGAEEQTIVATTARCTTDQSGRYREKGAHVFELPVSRGAVSLRSLLTRLGKLGVLHVLCEGGGELAEALIRQKLVDEMVLFVAGRIIGGAAASDAVAGEGWLLSSAPHFGIVESGLSGKDVMIRTRPER